MNYGINALKKIKSDNRFTQEELGKALGVSQTNVSNFLNGKVPISKPVALIMSEKFGYDYNKIIEMSNESSLKDSAQISNGKSKNSNEGKVLKNDDVVKIKTFIIPIKGFAGLKNAFYDDQYITENFDETTTEVPHYLYSPISYRIQSTGNSMPKSIPDGSWVTGVPVPEMMWLTYKFKQDKTYILFHPYRGILFKNVKNLSEHEIMLCSENEDKEEYPDEKFKINEFRKILLAIKVERFI